MQYIRTAAIIQLLLGNIGRPGGGIMALRGHASIQGSTDIPTLYNLLPGYLPMPKAEHDTRLRRRTSKHNDAAIGLVERVPEVHRLAAQGLVRRRAPPRRTTACFDYLPRLTGDHSHMTTVADMADGKVKGYFVMGENPVGRLA